MMTIRSGFFLFVRITLGIIYLWVVADRLGFLGPAGNMGVVWGDFEKFLDYTAGLNPWFPRAMSDILGYAATVVEVVLALLLISGIRLKEAALASFALLLIFASSLILAMGVGEAAGFIIFTVIAAATSLLLYREAKRRLQVQTI